MRLLAILYALLHLLFTGGCTDIQRLALTPETITTPISVTQGIGGRYEGTAISIGISPTWRIKPAPVAKAADANLSPAADHAR